MSLPRRFIDLHTHSFASDGALSPAEVVGLAEAAKLAAVALTDHDTTDGLAEARLAARQFPKLRFVPGLEVSARFSPGILHILALGIDEAAPPLREVIAQCRAARDERNPKIAAKLQAMGVPINMDDVRAAAAACGRRDVTVLGRLHIAEAIRRKGYAATVREAFQRYVAEGAPAYVAKDRLEAAEVISRIRAAGGAAVLAHPVQLRCQGTRELEQTVRRFVEAGLDGIEVYHSDHNDEQTRLYLELARRFGLLVAGGSDFHGPAKPDVRVGHPPVPMSVVAEPWASRWFKPPGR
jgi:hypothetical protein